MPEPIACPSCRRPINPSFKSCPFCKADVTGAPPKPAPAPRSEPVTCATCRRPFNAAFTRCPFCNAPAPTATPPTATAPAPARPQPLDFAALAQQAILMSKPFLPLEFHPAAAAAVDTFFEQTWGPEGKAPNDATWVPTDGQGAIILRYGSFLGELMRRELGGRWQLDTTNVLRNSVVFLKGLQAFPLAQAFNRMRDGAEKSFERLYLTTRLQLGVRSAPSEVEGWLRYARYFAQVGRGDLAGPFCRRALALGPDPKTAAEIQRLLATSPELAGSGTSGDSAA